MSRGAALVLLGLVPLTRTLVDAVDTTIELADRYGLSRGRVATEIGEWNVEAFLGCGFGLGFAVDHLNPAPPLVRTEQTEAIVYLGPLTLSAVRERLPEVAPLVGRPVAA